MGGRLKAKVAVITGAAGGIGSGMAKAFAAEGATLYLCDREADAVNALADEIGATAIVQDITQESEWQALHDRIAGETGALHILVNNAGVEVVKPISEMSLGDWRFVMSVNAEGAFLACKSMLPLLKTGGEPERPASVINISSIAGLIGFPNQVGYNVSKAGVGHLSRSLAIEWASYGFPIRVNSIYPGCIRTSMLELAVKGWVSAGVVPADDPWGAVGALCPMNRVGEISDVAMGALYLASDEARFVTGTDLVIDGGWMAR